MLIGHLPDYVGILPYTMCISTVHLCNIINK